MRPSRLLAVILSSPVCGGVPGPLKKKKKLGKRLENLKKIESLEKMWKFEKNVEIRKKFGALEKN